MTRLVAEADILLDDVDTVVGPVCEHLVEHGAVVGREGRVWTLTWPQGRARLETRSGGLIARAEADDREHLYLLRLGIASHVVEFAGEPSPEIRWTGDADDFETPPNYRVASVVGARDVTPHMRRVTLAGRDLDRFMTDEALHLKLLAPPDPRAPLQSPTVGADGLVVWPQGPDAPVRRTYTIRRFDRAAHTIDVDFVLHDDAGPGACWALAASAGDRIGLMGPGGGGVPRADRLLLAGDETALPAIARILETVPAPTSGRAIIEVEDASEEQDIRKPDGVEIIWLHRAGRPSDSARELFETAARLARSEEPAACFLWAGAEFQTFKAIRALARKDLGYPKDRHLVVSYWRSGLTEA